MELKNSVSIITGGSSGLGEATVRKFHSLGSKVCIFDCDNEKVSYLKLLRHSFQMPLMSLQFPLNSQK